MGTAWVFAIQIETAKSHLSMESSVWYLCSHLLHEIPWTHCWPYQIWPHNPSDKSVLWVQCSNILRSNFLSVAKIRTFRLVQNSWRAMAFVCSPKSFTSYRTTAFGRLSVFSCFWIAKITQRFLFCVRQIRKVYEGRLPLQTRLRKLQRKTPHTRL